MPPLSLGILGGLTGRLVTLCLVHGIWAGLVAASAAAIALRIVPHHRHRARYGLLLAAFGVVAVGPPLATALQRSRAAAREAIPMPVPAGTIVVIPGRVISGPAEAESGTTQGPVAPLARTSLLTRSGPIAARAAAASDVLQPVVLAAWLLVATPLASLLALGLLAAGARRREARPAPVAIQARSDRLARRLGLRRGPPVLVHPGLAEPCLCGLVRPAILLPGRWLAAADADRIDAVLAHELAHGRRLDLPVNFAQRLVEAVFFFHPAVHWLSRSLRRQRELCADAVAVSLTGDPLALAEALESVARLRATGRRATPLGASLGGEDLSLLTRVQELLGMTPSSPPARRWPLAAFPLATLVALLSASLGLAEDPPRAVSADAPADHPAEEPGSSIAEGDLIAVPSAGQHFDVRTAGHPSDLPFDWHRQISYEVRFVEAEANPWRQRLKERLRPVEDEADDSAWVLDRDELSELLTVIQSDTLANLVQAPKVTAFEGHHVTIANTYKKFYVADTEPIPGPDFVAWQPDIKDLALGSTLELSGTFRGGKTDLNLDLRDTDLVAIHTLRREEISYRGQRVTAAYQVPTTTERRRRLASPLPEGSTLMISLGLHERPGHLSGATKVAAALLQVAAGGPVLRARDATVERLVLITPRPIIVREEEERLGIPAVEAPSSRPGDR